MQGQVFIPATSLCTSSPQQDPVFAAVLCIASSAPGTQCLVLQIYQRPIFGLLSVQKDSDSFTPHPSMPCCWPQQAFSNQVFTKVSSASLAFYLESPTTVFETSQIFTTREPQPLGCPFPLFSASWKRVFPCCVQHLLVSKWLEGAQKGNAKCPNKDFFPRQALFPKQLLWCHNQAAQSIAFIFVFPYWRPKINLSGCPFHLATQPCVIVDNTQTYLIQLNLIVIFS